MKCVNQNKIFTIDDECILEIENFVKSKKSIKESKIDIFKSKFRKIHKNSLKVNIKIQKTYLLESFLIKVNSKTYFLLNYTFLFLGNITMVLAGYLDVDLTKTTILFAIAFLSLIFGGLYNNEVYYLQINERNLNEKIIEIPKKHLIDVFEFLEKLVA